MLALCQDRTPCVEATHKNISERLNGARRGFAAELPDAGDKPPDITAPQAPWPFHLVPHEKYINVGADIPPRSKDSSENKY